MTGLWESRGQEATEGEGDCPATIDTSIAATLPGTRWFCTRDAGHDGPHVAQGTHSLALAAWNDQ